MKPDIFRGYKKASLSVLLVSVIAVFLISAGLRYIELERWRDAKELYFVDKMPQTTTLDAYKWLRYAQEYKDGIYYPVDKDPLMFYPDAKSKHEQIPMLSWLIAKLSVFSKGNIYRTAVYLMPVLASLFIIPLGLYFYFTGIIPAGIAGGISGSLGIVYLVRTAMGRVDTDAMNLFFPFLTSLFVLLAVNNIDKVKKTVSVFRPCRAGDVAVLLVVCPSGDNSDLSCRTGCCSTYFRRRTEKDGHRCSVLHNFLKSYVSL
jgi:dolichyl-diphosphooligosaccharide--protein glycosyltransferase